jgi:hypothetical protein
MAAIRSAAVSVRRRGAVEGGACYGRARGIVLSCGDRVRVSDSEGGICIHIYLKLHPVQRPCLSR